MMKIHATDTELAQVQNIVNILLLANPEELEIEMELETASLTIEHARATDPEEEDEDEVYDETSIAIRFTADIVGTENYGSVLLNFSTLDEFNSWVAHERDQRQG